MGCTQSFAALKIDSRQDRLILLPDSYHIERDADVLALLRADDSVVAHFSMRGVEWSEVERVAEEDAGRSKHRIFRRVPTHSRRKSDYQHDE